MHDQDQITLKAGGQVYGGWKEISIRRGLDAPADAFDLTLTDKWAADMQRRPVKLGSAAEVWLGDQKLVTGYVDRVRPRYDAKSRSVTVSGRSKVADLVDCSPPASDLKGAQHNDQTFPQLARKVADIFGINVVVETDAEFPAIRIAAIEAEQTAFEFLEERSRSEAVMLVSNSDGDLVITRASDRKVGTALVLGENIEAADGDLSDRDRFSDYFVFAQQGGWGENYGAASAHVRGKSEDKAMRYRPTTIRMETAANPDQAQRRAEYQRNINYGRSRVATYTVTGWRHADGIWQPNRLVKVVDPWMGFDEWLMIAEVEFVLDERGRRTKLRVMPKEAFDLIPLPVEEKGLSW